MTNEELLENWYDIQDVFEETRTYNNEEDPREECQEN